MAIKMARGVVDASAKARRIAMLKATFELDAAHTAVVLADRHAGSGAVDCRLDAAVRALVALVLDDLVERTP